MTKSYKEITRNISRGMGEMQKSMPQLMAGFSQMAKSATADGALDEKTKELIALALGVAAHCDGCIGFHTKALVRLGASQQELEETLGMAVYMGGGPSLMYAAEAMHAYHEFSS
jgi:AhpD family alkylhydroperoxidase